MKTGVCTNCITISGNQSSRNTLLVSDLFNVFAGSFETLISYFEKDYRVVCYNDSGFGKNPKNRKLRYKTVSGYADEMVACLEANGISNIIFLAHSVNAMLAFMAAAKAPHLFDKIVLTSATPCLLHNQEILRVCGAGIHNLTDLFAFVMQKNKANAAAHHQAQTVQLTDVLSTLFFNMNEKEAYDIFTLLFTTDCTHLLSSFAVPTIILQVSGDVFSTKDIGYFMYRTIPESQFMRIKAKGQLPHVEAPEEIVQAIKFFIHSPSFF